MICKHNKVRGDRRDNVHHSLICGGCPSLGELAGKRGGPVAFEVKAAPCLQGQAGILHRRLSKRGRRTGTSVKPFLQTRNMSMENGTKDSVGAGGRTGCRLYVRDSVASCELS